MQGSMIQLASSDIQSLLGGVLEIDQMDKVFLRNVANFDWEDVPFPVDV